MRLGSVLLPWLLLTSLAGPAVASDPPPYEPPGLPLGYFHARDVRVQVHGTDKLIAVRDHAEDRPASVDSPRDESLTAEALANQLRDRLTDLLGYDERTLFFRVELLDASYDADSSTTRVGISVRARHADGRELATIRSASTLVGHAGGMSRRVGDHLQMALFDAFDRAVRRDEFIRATNAALTGARVAATQRIPEREQVWTIEPHESSRMAHVVGVAFDAGAAYGIGLRYLHDHLHVSNGVFWGAYGGEARLVTVDGDRLDALAGLAVLRAGMLVEQGFGLELGAGLGGKHGVSGVGLLGLFLSYYYVDIGLSLQFPIASEQPEWMAVPHFGLRVYVPVKAHGHVLKCRSPEACEPDSTLFR